MSKTVSTDHSSVMFTCSSWLLL